MRIGPVAVGVFLSAVASTGAARAQGGIASTVEPGSIDWAQYGAAFSTELLGRNGNICPKAATTPCILGSGGGFAVRVGYRSKDDYYLGFAYEFSKQNASNIYNLAILQQVRIEGRDYFARGDRLTPYVGAALGAAAYGDTWNVDTYGPLVGVTAGLEFEITRTVFVGFALNARAVDFKVWHDDTGQRRDGLPVLLGLELTLESRTQLEKNR